jgi:membrane protein required for colicin V production
MIFDVVVIIVLLASALFAFFRGFIREILTILGVLGGTVAAIYLGPFLVPLVQQWIGVDASAEEVKKLFGIVPYPLLADIISYSSIFLIFVVALSIISHMLANWAKESGLGMVDRVLGVIFGLARGMLILALLYLPVYLLIEEEERNEWGWTKECYSLGYVEKSAAWIYGIIPKSEGLDIEKGKEDVENIAVEVRKKMQELDVMPEKEETDDDSDYHPEEREGMNGIFGRAMEE